MTITYIYGPPASGKTTNADYLKGKYAAKRVVDEWHAGDTRLVLQGDLVLGQDPSIAPRGSTIIHIAQALR